MHLHLRPVSDAGCGTWWRVVTIYSSNPSTSRFWSAWQRSVSHWARSQSALAYRTVWVQSDCHGLRRSQFWCSAYVLPFDFFRMLLSMWRLLDADGWCLMMVLYMVLSDVLAERRMARRTQACWKGCSTLAGASLADSGLLQVGLFPVAVHVICPLGWYLGKSGETQARRRRRRGKTASIRADREQKCHRHDTKLPYTHAS